MARFVAPYRKSSKNDGNDAEAICEAVARPNMRFVPVKSAEQQAILALHRVRRYKSPATGKWVKARNVAELHESASDTASLS